MLGSSLVFVRFWNLSGKAIQPQLKEKHCSKQKPIFKQDTLVHMSFNNGITYVVPIRIDGFVRSSLELEDGEKKANFPIF